MGWSCGEEAKSVGRWGLDKVWRLAAAGSVSSARVQRVWRWQEIKSTGLAEKKIKPCAGPRARKKVKGVKKAVYPGPRLNLSLHPPALSSPPAPEEGLGQGWHWRSSENYGLLAIHIRSLPSTQTLCKRAMAWRFNGAGRAGQLGKGKFTSLLLPPGLLGHWIPLRHM